MAAERTRRKAKLGRRMQALREAAGAGELTPVDVARQMRVAATTVTRLEGGYSRPAWAFISGLLGIYGASEQQRREVEALWENAKQTSTTVENAADLPLQYRAFRRDEGDAAEEWCTDPILVSGLLQTPRYARAVQEAARRHIRGEGWEDKAADERRSRQRLLDGDDPLKLRAIMGQAVITSVTGDPHVMAEQLQYLLDMGKRDNVEIQIVPWAAGAWGVMSGPVTVLRFETEEDPDLAYLEYAGGGETVENQTDVQAFADTFEDVSEHKALSSEESAKLIGAALDALKEL